MVTIILNCLSKQILIQMDFDFNQYLILLNNSNKINIIIYSKYAHKNSLLNLNVTNGRKIIKKYSKEILSGSVRFRLFLLG